VNTHKLRVEIAQEVFWWYRGTLKRQQQFGTTFVSPSEVKLAAAAALRKHPTARVSIEPPLPGWSPADVRKVKTHLEMDEDELELHVQNFCREFALLVRKYAPDYGDATADRSLLYRMHGCVNCFNPYVWSDIADLQKVIK
jgi:hypothetical protein